MTRPSQGALDFARRHNLPEPRTREEVVEQMRRVIGLPMWEAGRTTQTNNTRYDAGDDNNGGREDDN